MYILTIVGCFSFQIFRQDYSDWMLEEAVVLDTWIENNNHVRYHRTYYWTKFSYEIDGAQYENETRGVNINAVFGYDGTNYEKTAIGETVDIRVNPIDYRDSILVNDIHSNKDIWILVLSIVTCFNIIVICIHVVVYLNEKKEQKQKK